VNSVWGGYENMVEGGVFTWVRPFWEQPLWRWEAMFGAGVRASYVASRFAAPIMLGRGSGLIVALSSYWSPQKHKSNVAYRVAKAATERMIVEMAHELRPHGIAAVCLYPGLVRTERVMQFAQYLDLSNSESPQFAGRAVAALTADPRILEKSGRVVSTAELAEEYGFTDIDGRRPRPLPLDEA
jgi:NAD(P)-dependent dehydrogenase (short-subunit alcohol dehydrogenase family)